MRGPPLHPSWAERDDINRAPPRPALSTPSAPPQPAHRRPPLLPNCPNNLPGNLKPSSGQTTLSRIPPGSPFSNPSHSVGARMKISPFRENCNFSSLWQVLQRASPSPPPSSHPHSQQPFYRSSISISFRAGWKSITGGGLCRPIGSRQPGGGGGAQVVAAWLPPAGAIYLDNLAILWRKEEEKPRPPLLPGFRCTLPIAATIADCPAIILVTAVCRKF